VLIGCKGKAYLSDFGLSTIIADIQGSSYFTSTIAGAIRWAAAELYRYEEDHVPTLTFECDIYSFGSVMLQVNDIVIWYYFF
jgi:serine/threonine protein kinase